MSSSSKKFEDKESPSDKSATKRPTALSLNFSEETEDEQSPQSAIDMSTPDMISPPSSIGTADEMLISPPSSLRSEPLFELHYTYEDLPTKDELLSALKDQIAKSSAFIKQLASEGEWYEVVLLKDGKKPKALSVKPGKIYVIYNQATSSLTYSVLDPKNALVEGAIDAWAYTSKDKRFGNDNFKEFVNALTTQDDTLTPKHKQALLEVTTYRSHTLNSAAAIVERIKDVTTKLTRDSKTSFTFDFAAKDVIFPPKGTGSSIPEHIMSSEAYKVFAKNFEELQKNWLDAHATKVELTIKETAAGTVGISVKDNGKGFSEGFLKTEEMNQPKSYGQILYPFRYPYTLQLLLQKEKPSLEQLKKQGVALPALIKVDAKPPLFYLYGSMKNKPELTTLDNQSSLLLAIDFKLKSLQVAEDNDNKDLFAFIKASDASEEKVSKIKSDKAPTLTDWGGAGRGLSGIFSDLQKMGGDVLIQNIFSPSGDIVGASVTLVSPTKQELRLRKNSTADNMEIEGTFKLTLKKRGFFENKASPNTPETGNDGAPNKIHKVKR